MCIYVFEYQSRLRSLLQFGTNSREKRWKKKVLIFIRKYILCVHKRRNITTQHSLQILNKVSVEHKRNTSNWRTSVVPSFVYSLYLMGLNVFVLSIHRVAQWPEHQQQHQHINKRNRCNTNQSEVESKYSKIAHKN